MAELPTKRFRRASIRNVSLALALLLPALALLALGNDGNWDLRNYHFYGPHAWLHGRNAIDVAPAQMQGFHNPLLDLPMYLLASAGAPPKLVGLWLTLPAMAALWLVLRLQQRLSTDAPGFGARAMLALLALTGAATWSTLGLSMNDAWVAAGMLAALALLVDTDSEAPTPGRCLAAGLLAGATAGLKLSGGFYCPALAAALLLVPGTMRVRVGRLALLASGGVLGLALTYGWWGWSLWLAHGNPFFPYFNDVFRSPDVAANAWVDERFRAKGLLDALLAPLRLTWRSRLFSEGGMKDPRLLLAVLGFGWLAWSARARPEASAIRLRLLQLLAFVLVSVLAWMLQSGVYRYAMAIELLGCLALVLVLQRLPRWRGAAMLLAFLLVSADTRRPDWQRVSSPLSSIPTLAGGAVLPANALVVTMGAEPLGYLALALPDSVAMLGLRNNLVQPGDCGGLTQRAAQRLAAHAGPVYLATSGDAADQQALRRAYGFASRGKCIRVRASIGDALLCPQERVAAAQPACQANQAHL